MMKKILLGIFIFVLTLSIFNIANAGVSSDNDPATKIALEVQKQLSSLQPNQMVTVIVTLKDQFRPDNVALQNIPHQQQVILGALRSHAQIAQQAISAVLETDRSQGRVANVIPFWVFNGLSVTATSDVIQELATRMDVLSITPDTINIVPVGTQNLAAPASNITAIKAPALWDLGYYGQGVVVANMDTGVDVNHPELASHWRGGSDSWYDPYNQHPITPTDLNGHGTWTMGVMVAGDGSGTTLGVAPQAQWIAVKIFNDSGSATATAIHLGFQWLLDPDNNPATADAPQVVNNSWAYGSPGCNLEFQNDLKSLRLVGILPVFSAGNNGPNPSTSVSPANYPEAFAIGAVDNSGVLQVSSGRGPSACGETSTIYPELVAPGANITTTDLFSLYTQASGTSMSAPHVSGVLALLSSAFPGLSIESQAAALMNTAVDLGSVGPDNDYGYGMIDALAAYNWLLAGNRVTPTPIPTATATALPTATATPLPTSTPVPSPTPTAVVDKIYSDGFESGNLGQWSSAVTDGGRLSVSGQAALAGSFGMQALINSTKSIYVVDTSPVAEATYHARFYFSPNNVVLPRNKTQDLFVGRISSGTAIFRIQIQYISGSYQVRGVTLTGSGKTLTTSWYTISNSAHAVEISWQAASTLKGTDGTFSLWLDGSLKETRSGVANGGYRLEDVLLGPQAVPSGTSGSEYFDAFSSTHTTYIGP
jgi:subtilisin family serine protease